MNSVSLVGRMTRDIDLRYTNDQKAVGKFSIAVKREVKDAVDFINCVAFGKTAELIETYSNKGKLIEVNGRIQTGSYEKDGAKHYTFDVIVDRVGFLEWKDKEGGKPVDIEIDMVESDIPF